MRHRAGGWLALHEARPHEQRWQPHRVLHPSCLNGGAEIIGRMIWQALLCVDVLATGCFCAERSCICEVAIAKGLQSLLIIEKTEELPLVGAAVRRCAGDGLVLRGARPHPQAGIYEGVCSL